MEFYSNKFQEIRRNYDGLLPGQGESPVYVKVQPSHSIIQMTVDIYGHWMQTVKKQASYKSVG